MTENKFTAVLYIVEGNLLYFSHRDLTGGLAFTFLRNLNILSWVKIIVLGVYSLINQYEPKITEYVEKLCPNTSIPYLE